MTFRTGMESSQSKSHKTTIIQDFTLASTITPYTVRLPLRAAIPSYLTHSTLHYLRSWKVFPAIETICVSSTCRGMRLSFLERHWMAWSVSNWLDAIKYASSLCRRQHYHWYWSGLLTRWWRLTFEMSLVRWQKSTFRMSLVRWQRTDTSKSLFY